MNPRFRPGTLLLSIALAIAAAASLSTLPALAVRRQPLDIAYLDCSKQVSLSQAQLGDRLAYTITLTNTSVVTPFSVLLTDTLPVDVAADPASLWASTGEPMYASGTLTWAGTIPAGDVVSVIVEGLVSRGMTTLQNHAVVDVAGLGTCTTNQCQTVVDPVRLHLPLVLRSYCSDFFDDFSDPASGWLTGDDGYVGASYVDGEYRVLSHVGGYIYLFAAPTCARERYTVEVDARWVQPSTTYARYGILFGITSNFNQYYFVDVSPGIKQYGVWRRNPGGSITNIEYMAPHPAINGGSATNHLRVTLDGTTIKVEINGATAGTFHDIYDGAITGLTYVGLAIIPYWENPESDARFDNFSVASLNGVGAGEDGPAGTRCATQASGPGQSRIERLARPLLCE
jgi:uncharacterized repeat protein (TIGR01451 family)